MSEIMSEILVDLLLQISSVANQPERRLSCHSGNGCNRRTKAAAMLLPHPSLGVRTRIRCVTGIGVDVQAIFFRRRHQPRRPPLARIRPGRHDYSRE